MSLPRDPLPALVALALAGAIVAACGGPASPTPAPTGPAAPCTTPSDCPDPGTTCQTATCVDGRCGTIDAAVDTTCADAGGAVCDGAGSCVACNFDAECAGTTNVCASVTCAGHACATRLLTGPAPVPDTPGDCQTLACQDGAVVVDYTPADVVTTTPNPCVGIACTIYSGGPPTSDPLVVGTIDVTYIGLPCDATGTPGTCDASGACVP